jgi:hypothetical protein
VDNGTNSPTTQNPITSFGFTISPGPASGDFLIDVLVPSNEQTGGATYAITGTYSGTATLFSASDWTSGFLATFLGISAKPSNPISGYLDSSEAALDPTATGFSVYQVDLGTRTLQGPSNPNSSPLLNIAALPIGSYIVGFLNKGTTGSPKWIATANSGAILEKDDPVPPVPEPMSIALFGGVLLLTAGALRRRFL